MTRIPMAPPTSMLELADQIRLLDPARTLDAVIADLRTIQVATTGSIDPDHRALEGDGVGCFNFMYLRVTERIRALPAGASSPFIDRLAVVFAEFYLRNYRARTTPPGYVSKAWEPLFEDRRERRITGLQFAVAGLNAHINNDLAWALMQVWDEIPGAAQQLAEFEAVNAVLAAAQSEVRSRLEAGWLRWIDQLLRGRDDAGAAFSVAKARERAWERAIDLRGSVVLSNDTMHERQVGFQSHLILAPRVDFGG